MQECQTKELEIIASDCLQGFKDNEDCADNATTHFDGKWYLKETEILT